MEYIAGWDGGGTKTLCKAADLATGRTYRFAAGPLNPNGSAPGRTEAAAASLLAEMAALPGGLAGCRMLCIAAAGLSNPDTAMRLRGALARAGYTGPVRLAGDQQAALYGALGGPVGAVLIAGTGSICYGRTADGREARSGGWGSLMDDEGGGYALGRDILAAVVRARDGRGQATCLEAAVFRRLGVEDMEGMMRAIYAPDTGKREVAALARLLDPALAAGDPAAKAIAAKAAGELALLVRPVVERLGLERGRLALAGGVLTGSAPIRAGVVEALARRYPGLECVDPQRDAATGAVLMAQEALEGGGPHSV